MLAAQCRTNRDGGGGGGEVDGLSEIPCKRENHYKYPAVAGAQVLGHIRGPALERDPCK